MAGNFITHISILPFHNNASISHIISMTSPANTDDVTHNYETDIDFRPATEDTASYETVIKLQNVVIPILCTLGLVFNVMAVRILVQRALRKKSCCMYLTTKCLTDSVFLAALFVVWLDRIELPWFHRHGVCQIIIFTTYVCAFTSVWLVVMVTAENYIRICHPHRVQTLCTMGNARVVLMSLGIISILCYQFPLWTVHSVELENTTRCALIPEYDRFNNGLTYFDTAVTLVVPLLLVLVFMTAIFHQLWFSFKRNKRMKRLGRQRHTHFMHLSPYGRVTAMLLAVSFTFVVLHTPSHVIRLKLLLSQAVKGDNYYVGIAHLRLQRLFELLYYSNFSTNWLTYFSFGKQFRDLYKQTFCHCLINHSPTVCNCSRREMIMNNGRVWERRRASHKKSGHLNMADNGGTLPGHHNYACLSLPNLYHGEVEEDGMVTEMVLVSTDCINAKVE